MSFSQPNLTVTTSAQTYNNPAALGGQSATQIQIQNSSAFIIQVLAGGEQYVIQPFVAQTVPLGGSQGASITIEGIASPSGLSTDNLTLIWLLPGESPPMQDGPLTAAALVAATLPPGIVFGPEVINGTPATFSVTVPANSRTLILNISQGGGFLTPLNIEIQGQETGQNYYNQAPYLSGGIGAGHTWTVVCPVNGAADTTYTIVVTYGAAPVPTTYTVSADTDQYEESVFYNGVGKALSQTSTAANNYTVITGPARILGYTLSWQAGAVFAVTYNGPQLIAQNPAVAGGIIEKTFPDNTILPALQSIILETGNADVVTMAVEYAYP